MPIRKVGKRYQYGRHGKLYRSRKLALRQMRAIKASQARRKRA